MQNKKELPADLPKQLIESLKDVPGFNEEAFIKIHHSGEQVTSIRYNPAKITGGKLDDHVFPSTGKSQPVSFLQPTINDQPTTSANDQPTTINELPPTTNDQPSTTNDQPLPSIVPWCQTGRYLPQRPSFTLDPAFHAGAYYVQEASSMFLDHVVSTLYAGVEPPQRVLDLCAAPGGKSTLLASRFTESFIVSNEVIKNRVTILAENVSKWGSSNVAVTHNDPKDFKRLPGYFDLVVIDAPCSGSGLFRKDPQAVEEWSEANVAMCSHRQQRILADILPSLRQNGYLIYSTCSYSTKEDEDICDWIIDDLDVQPVAIPIDSSWGIVEAFSAKHQAPGFRFYPDKLKGEGFFIACFKQQNPVDEYDDYPAGLVLPSKDEVKLIEPWLKNPESIKLYRQKETIIAFPLKWEEEFTLVQKNLSVRKSGVAIGTIKGKDLVPHHEFALSHLLNPTVPFAELDEAQALRYLKRQDLQLQTEVKGWALARYKNLNLGWMKLLGNRINNYYPTDWRILKP